MADNFSTENLKAIVPLLIHTTEYQARKTAMLRAVASPPNQSAEIAVRSRHSLGWLRDYRHRYGNRIP